MKEKSKPTKQKRKLTRKEAAIKSNKEFRTFAKDLVKSMNSQNQKKK